LGRIPDPIRLEGKQRAIFDALTKQDKRLANMYYGALLVLGDDQNPEQLPLAAHCIRELMEKMPEFKGLSVKVQRQKLKPRVDDLHDFWKKAIGTDIAQAVERLFVLFQANQEKEGVGC
jgi:hypothetical protein